MGEDETRIAQAMEAWYHAEKERKGMNRNHNHTKGLKQAWRRHAYTMETIQRKRIVSHWNEATSKVNVTVVREEITHLGRNPRQDAISLRAYARRLAQGDASRDEVEKWAPVAREWMARKGISHESK